MSAKRSSNTNFDDANKRYRGLRGGQNVLVSDGDAGLLVRPEVARRQIDAESIPTPGPTPGPGPSPGQDLLPHRRDPKRTLYQRDSSQPSTWTQTVRAVTSARSPTRLSCT